MNNKKSSMKAKTVLHSMILIPTLVYGSETWAWTKKDESGINAVEMRSLRRISNVRLTNRTRNERVREMCGLKRSIVERMKVNKLRWFGHMERMNDERMTKIIYREERMGERRQGRPRMGWVEGIENILKEGVGSTKCRRACMRACMRNEEAKDVCRNRVKWHSILSAYPARDMA
jgi:hypothetical protein